MSNRQLKQVEFRGTIGLDFDTLAFTVLSSVLASVALLKGSIPILIGSMVLSPTFDPLIAIPFAILHRNVRMTMRALFFAAIQFLLAFAVCMTIVYIWSRITFIPYAQGIIGAEIVTERLQISWGSVATALTAGAGGALAYAAERRIHLVGVVIAIALVPTLAAAAIGFIINPPTGWGGLALFGVNAGSVILAGLIVLALRKETGIIEEEQEGKR